MESLDYLRELGKNLVLYSTRPDFDLEKYKGIEDNRIYTLDQFAVEYMK